MLNMHMIWASTELEFQKIESLWINIIFACFINLNATQNSYKKYKKFMNSKLSKPAQSSDSVS